MVTLGGAAPINVRITARRTEPPGTLRCAWASRADTTCTDTPRLEARSAVADGGGYKDVPCADDAPPNTCGSRCRHWRPAAVAAARPLSIVRSSIPIDHLGAYQVSLGAGIHPEWCRSVALRVRRYLARRCQPGGRRGPDRAPLARPAGNPSRTTINTAGDRVSNASKRSSPLTCCGSRRVPSSTSATSPCGSDSRSRPVRSRDAGFGTGGARHQTAAVPASGRRIQRQPRASTSADRSCRVRRWTVVRGCVRSRVGRSRTVCVPMSASRAPPPLSDGRNRRPTVRRNDWLVRSRSSTPSSRTVESGWSGGALGAVGRRPFGCGRIVLDEERRAITVQWLRRGQAPPDDASVGTDPFAIDRLGEGRAPIAEPRDVGREIVAGDRPCREAAAGLERPERRRADPRARRRRAVEHADELEIAVAEPDQPVERPEPVVAAAAAGRQPELRLELRRGGVRVRDRDDQVVDPEEHRRSMRHGP